MKAARESVKNTLYLAAAEGGRWGNRQTVMAKGMLIATQGHAFAYVRESDQQLRGQNLLLSEHLIY